MPSFGETREVLEVGPVRVAVRYGCVRRDQYDIRCEGPLPESLMPRLGATGTLRGTPALYVVEVPGVHQVTVAPAMGRVVVMPRLERSRPEQRDAAMGVVELIVEALRG